MDSREEHNTERANVAARENRTRTAARATPTNYARNADPEGWLELARQDLSFDDHPHSDSDIGPAHPGLVEIQPLNELFTRALSYRTYRLRNTDRAFNRAIASELANTAKMVRHSMHRRREFHGR